MIENILEAAIGFLSEVPWYWVLVIAVVTTFVENIFPPAPGDSIVVFTGTLISLGTIGFVPLLLASTLGSVLGFAAMYYIGFKVDSSILESNRFSFISKDGLLKVETWFQKYGYGLIIANRFLSGTRAVISFFAGLSKLSFPKTMILSAISAMVWNGILLSLGYFFANQRDLVRHYMQLYGKILVPIGIVIALILLAKWYFNTKKAKTATEKETV